MTMLHLKGNLSTLIEWSDRNYVEVNIALPSTNIKISSTKHSKEIKRVNKIRDLRVGCLLYNV